MECNKSKSWFQLQFLYACESMKSGLISSFMSYQNKCKCLKQRSKNDYLEKLV